MIKFLRRKKSEAQVQQQPPPPRQSPQLPPLPPPPPLFAKFARTASGTDLAGLDGAQGRTTTPRSITMPNMLAAGASDSHLALARPAMNGNGNGHGYGALGPARKPQSSPQPAPAPAPAKLSRAPKGGPSPPQAQPQPKLPALTRSLSSAYTISPFSPTSPTSTTSSSSPPTKYQNTNGYISPPNSSDNHAAEGGSGNVHRITPVSRGAPPPAFARSGLALSLGGDAPLTPPSSPGGVLNGDGRKAWNGFAEPNYPDHKPAPRKLRKRSSTANPAAPPVAGPFSPGEREKEPAFRPPVTRRTSTAVVAPDAFPVQVPPSPTGKGFEVLGGSRRGVEGRRSSTSEKKGGSEKRVENGIVNGLALNGVADQTPMPAPAPAPAPTTPSPPDRPPFFAEPVSTPPPPQQPNVITSPATERLPMASTPRRGYFEVPHDPSPWITSSAVEKQDRPRISTEAAPSPTPGQARVTSPEVERLSMTPRQERPRISTEVATPPIASQGRVTSPSTERLPLAARLAAVAAAADRSTPSTSVESTPKNSIEDASDSSARRMTYTNAPAPGTPRVQAEGTPKNSMESMSDTSARRATYTNGSPATPRGKAEAEAEHVPRTSSPTDMSPDGFSRFMPDRRSTLVEPPSSPVTLRRRSHAKRNSISEYSRYSTGSAYSNAEVGAPVVGEAPASSAASLASVTAEPRSSVAGSLVTVSSATPSLTTPSLTSTGTTTASSFKRKRHEQGASQPPPALTKLGATSSPKSSPTSSLSSRPSHTRTRSSDVRYKLPAPRPASIPPASSSEPEPEVDPVYPLAQHLTQPDLLANLLPYLNYRDWTAVYSLAREPRAALQDNRALREVVLERYLWTVGYRKWRDEGAKEPLVLSLKDLNSYLRGVSIATHQYSVMAENYLNQKDASSASLLRSLASSARAYTKLVLRLRAQAEDALKRHNKHAAAGNSPSPDWESEMASAFRSPLFRLGHAPLLRVFVPSPAGAWLSDESVVECEKELRRAGVMKLVRRGDVVWDAAVSDEGNVGRLIWDGNYLIDLEYEYSASGQLPRAFNSLAFPPSYWHKVIRSASNPLAHIDLRPYGAEIAGKVQLLPDRVQAETPQGAHHTIMRWTHRAQVRVRAGAAIPECKEVVDRAWEGRLVIEAEGTNEGLAELQARCGVLFPGVTLPPSPGHGGRETKAGRSVFKVLREKSRPGEVWVRVVKEEERIM